MDFIYKLVTEEHCPENQYDYESTVGVYTDFDLAFKGLEWVLEQATSDDFDARFTTIDRVYLVKVKANVIADGHRIITWYRDNGEFKAIIA